ncbi:methyltransferase domain-containing protein [Geobacter pelophilus]|uniref:Methyltransferase domain-containing protein n=1 Tax=Geoanaerobacter pelophilus TaxID=60036 RepID=A0AAW4L5S4_9BACT|nr:class I SAM-dependent methyltransferase [Geoanaerobacter pelophilus]MBT0663384.1 methyltransferase domain-containing protein [Geoanaerobacter pelophilus]
MTSTDNPADSCGESADLRGAVALAHHFLRNVVKPGDRVVDATCGNGNDTLFLAKLVGEHGRVWAFDIQPSAIEKTSALLAAHQCASQVELIAGGHEGLSALVKEPLSAAVFNLGFLPGGDKGCITHGATTIAALAQAAALLTTGGIVTVAAYPGHSGGDDESQAVEQWASGLPPHIFNVWRHRQLNRSAVAPYLILVERRPS